MPPSLSYKSKAQREQEERERKEREEAERLQRERYQAKQETAERAFKVGRARALQQPPGDVPTPGPPSTAAPEKDLTPRPSVTDPKSLVMFKEDGLAPTRREIDDIEMLGGPEEDVVEVEEAEEERVEAAPKRRPPRPPKSPDMRPVFAGFILVFTGLAQFIYGVWVMVQSPNAAVGIWSPLVKWGAFSMGLTAALLGLLAIRGGLWSFRKERFSVVKVGAIAATLCIWAWWIPWLFGLAALVIVHKARDEYYPFYDPRWDAPDWARPPPDGEEETTEEEALEERDEMDIDELLMEDHPKNVAARVYLEGKGPAVVKEAQGLQDAVLKEGDGWEDVA